MTLEQELVRAEAENLVAEAQLTNVTRQKLKEAYTQQVDAIIERSEKQAILASHTRRLLELLDDTPVVPGAEKAAYDNERVAKEILLDAEEELGKWERSQDMSVPSSRLENNLLPSLGNGPIIQSDAHSIPGGSDERDGKVPETNNPETSTHPYDSKALETAT
jgi:hypothetical protein